VSWVWVLGCLIGLGFRVDGRTGFDQEAVCSVWD
jgi:hypothetical protein